MGVLNACVNIYAHENLRACMIMDKPLKLDKIQIIFFGSRLVDMYAQCGSKIGRFPYKFGDVYV
jgi:hypothetical protein